MLLIYRQRGWKYSPCLTCLLGLILLFINMFTYFSWREFQPHATPQYNWIARPVMAVLDRQKTYNSISAEQHSFVVTNPKCDALLAGDGQEVNLTKEMLYKDSRIFTSEEQLAHQAHNCTNFFNQHKFSSILLPSKLELEFPIAYIITVHKNAEQVVRLLQAIYAPQNVYCIHIDVKSPFQFKNVIQEVVNCFPNMFIASKLEEVVYAGFNRLQADINCLHDLVRLNLKWYYAINLCGQDFPLKTNLDIVRHLINLDGKNDIPGIIPEDKLHQDRINYVHEVIAEFGKPLVSPTSNLKSSPPHNITIFFGTAYNILSREFVNYVVSDLVAQDLLKWMEDIYSPDENYWATLNHLVGTPGGSIEPSWNSKARAIKWSFFGGKLYPPCQGIYQRSVCIYGVGDLNWLINQPHLFANKFDLDVDHIALQCMDYHLRRMYTTQRQQIFVTRPVINESDILKKFNSQVKLRHW